MHAPAPSRSSIAAAVLVACAVLVAGCDDAETVAPPEVTFETLFVGVDELADSFPRERLVALEGELQKGPVDVLCLQGLWSAIDRDELRAALERVFPYSLDLPTDVDDPFGVDGEDPPDLGPPCTSAEDKDELEALVACVQGKCSTAASPDDPHGRVVSLRCAASRCVLGASSPRGRCHQCFHGQFRTGATFRDIHDRCENSNRPLAHAGQHGLMLLSKLPVEASSRDGLPGEGVRRAVIGATLRSAGGPLDVYCTALGPPEAGGLPGDPSTLDPYAGPYGDEKTGWAAEQALQVDKLVAHVRARAGGRRAVVLGNFNASRFHRAKNGQTILAERGPVAAERLLAAFSEAVPAGYEPVCTLCPDNPLPRDEMWPEGVDPANILVSPLPEATWVNRIFLFGWPSALVRATVRTHLGKIVSVEQSDVIAEYPEWYTWGQAPLAAVPVSVQYGLRSRIAVEP